MLLQLHRLNNTVCTRDYRSTPCYHHLLNLEYCQDTAFNLPIKFVQRSSFLHIVSTSRTSLGRYKKPVFEMIPLLFKIWLLLHHYVHSFAQSYASLVHKSYLRTRSSGQLHSAYSSLPSPSSLCSSCTPCSFWSSCLSSSSSLI
jgi:hypothetical protein